jgi:hypothetical protein
LRNTTGLVDKQGNGAARVVQAGDKSMRDWVARDHEEGDELAPFQLIEVHSIRAGPALVCIELGVSMTAILLKNTLFSKLMSAPNFRPKRD